MRELFKYDGEYEYNGMVLQIEGDVARLYLRPYWTVVIPPTTPNRWTKWHSGKQLTRGAFNTEEEATAWAEKNLEGNDFQLQRIVSEPQILSEEEMYRVLIHLEMELMLDHAKTQFPNPQV